MHKILVFPTKTYRLKVIQLIYLFITQKMCLFFCSNCFLIQWDSRGGSWSICVRNIFLIVIHSVLGSFTCRYLKLLWILLLFRYSICKDSIEMNQIIGMGRSKMISRTQEILYFRWNNNNNWMTKFSGLSRSNALVDKTHSLNEVYFSAASCSVQFAVNLFEWSINFFCAVHETQVQFGRTSKQYFFLRNNYSKFAHRIKCLL